MLLHQNPSTSEIVCIQACNNLDSAINGLGLVSEDKAHFYNELQPMVQGIKYIQAFISQNLSLKVKMWPWKYDQGNQNLPTSFPYSTDKPALVR